ncbi:DNA-3-methyladenine glycosylase [Cytobacillus purgationiresistens]|uniref:Putative 3-methyladenine DNA glycosylase n=1 Tax=Cytobacillus purgationiresistens TaxID=863449 RepID=A0ABU0AR01_9BACI|nr:DNA-3-methyladenine glycosylase [Cytobacillus purgationiresistens]MDQ0273638.1 DNA-3-methyladenine glycosylase [Cytobacillus purgationiresistens]
MSEMLSSQFYRQPTLELAKALLGCLLVKETPDGTASGYIVETEAYKGPDDQAAHSYKNRRTKRTEVMFHHPGVAYTYVMHTHCLVNVVSGALEKPEAILIRAIEPVEGIELMKERRKTTILKNLTSGPGKLTKALDIHMGDYGQKLIEKPIYILKGYTPAIISEGKRIGIDNSGEAKDYPWRYWITDNPFVSKHQKEENRIHLP